MSEIKKATKSNRGGARPNSGRPKLERTTKKHTIPLFADDMEKVKALPCKMTSFVREAIAEKLERENKPTHEWETVHDEGDYYIAKRPSDVLAGSEVYAVVLDFQGESFIAFEVDPAIVDSRIIEGLWGVLKKAE